MSRGKNWKLGWLVAKKQPQVVKIPPHMVLKLYCERYFFVKSLSKGKICEGFSHEETDAPLTLCRRKAVKEEMSPALNLFM